MKNGAIKEILLATAAVLALASVPAQADPKVTQSFDLRPGWNAVYLEVQPDPRDPATVFAGLPVESVWVWLNKNSAIDFIQNPDEGLWDVPGWCAYFTAPKEAFLTNLFAVFANWAYLIKLGGSEAVTWTVTGSPSPKAVKWVGDSFNLVGFHVSPESPPDAQSFFAPSEAHAGQAIYRLNEQGRWDFVDDPSTTPLRGGEACWVFCEGSSTYQGPLQVYLPMDDGLDYGATLTVQTITLQNVSDVSRTVSFTQLASAGSGEVVLVYRKWDKSTGFFTWLPLTDMGPIELAPEGLANVKLGVRREDMAVGLSESILKIADDKGIRFLVPVSVERIQ